MKKSIVFCCIFLICFFVSCKCKDSDCDKTKSIAKKIVVKKLQKRAVAYIQKKAMFSQIPSVIEVLYDYLKKNKIKPLSPPMGIYLTDPKTVKPEENVWQICVVVEGKIKEDAVVKYKEIAEMTVASLIFIGDYKEDIFTKHYKILKEYIKNNKYQIAGPPMEMYLSKKGVMGAKETKTEIMFPIKK